MRKLTYKLLFALVLLALTTAASESAFAQKKNKNQQILPTTGKLSLKTSPDAYPVLINGKEYGTTGVGTPNEIDLPPGTYNVEIGFPNKPYTREMKVEAGRRACMCLTYAKKVTSRPCPYDVRVDAPTAVVDGDIIAFSANPSYTGPPATLIYKWTVSPDTAVITSGQGTPSITVDSTGMSGKTVAAMLEVDTGYDDNSCRQRIPVETSVGALPPPPKEPFMVDWFDANKGFDDVKARLDNFAIALQGQPDVQGYVIVYGKAGTKASVADRLGIRALDYLTRNLKLDSRRIVVVNGGFKKQQGFELYLVPPGADPPMPNPQ